MLVDGLLNLTPRDINVFCDDGTLITYPKCGDVLRLESVPQVEQTPLTSGVCVVSAPKFSKIIPSSLKELSSWPVIKQDRKEMRGIIVSMVVAQHIAAMSPEEAQKWRASWVTWANCDLDVRPLDVYSPDKGVGAKRNSEGNIVGVIRLCKWQVPSGVRPARTGVFQGIVSDGNVVIHGTFAPRC